MEILEFKKDFIFPKGKIEGKIIDDYHLFRYHYKPKELKCKICKQKFQTTA